MENTIKQITVNALRDLYQTEITLEQVKLEPTNSDFKGDFTLLTFPFLRFSKKNPEQTAQELGLYLVQNITEIEQFNVVKGFLNLEISPSYWVNKLVEVNCNVASSTHQKVMVE